MNKETQWVPIQQLEISNIAEGFINFIQLQTSLTHAIKKLAKDKFELRLLHQSWMQNDSSRKEVVFVREIFLIGDDTPWIYGRSVIPKTTYFAQPTIQSLQLKPLGDVLFNAEKISRDPFLYTKLTKEYIEYQQVAHHLSFSSSFLYARQSTFWLDKNPLFLMETFLPDFLTRFF